ncbi:MAG: hypothetical protein ACIAQ0_09685 [Phycisphaerales bacterium JB058]
MTRMLCALALVLSAAGCQLNEAPIYLYMTTDEMQHAIDARYCAGMTSDDVIDQLEADRMTYFAERDATGEVGTIEVRILTRGVVRQTRPTFGRMIMGFHDDELISIDYGHPDELREERWVFSGYRLEDCDSTGMDAVEAARESGE